MQRFRNLRPNVVPFILLAWASATHLLTGCGVAGTVAPSDYVVDAAVGGGNTGGQGPADNNTVTQPNTVVTNPVPTDPNAAAPPAVRAKAGVAMYWGTGNNNGKDPDFSSLCQDGDINIIIVSFVDAIASRSTNANGNPHMSINECYTPWDGANKRLGRCPDLGTKITACQAKGKQVILSIGGGGAQVSFVSDAEAKSYASLIWNMFLGGPGSIRPFGPTAVLDGIDLDVENGPTTGYAAFVLELRRLMLTDSKKPYLITAAPQCPFPDAWMGPDGRSFDGSTTLKGTALTLALTAFDHLFVQFYNNFCAFTSPQDFTSAWQKWTTLGPKQPKIWVGLPATSNAADPSGYVQPAKFGNIVQAVGADPLFGGLMFWDAGYDADVIASGQKAVRTWAAEAVAKAGVQ